MCLLDQHGSTTCSIVCQGRKLLDDHRVRWQFFWRGDCYIPTSAWCFTHSKQVKQRQHDGGCLNSCSIGEIRWKLRCWKISQRCQQLPDNLPHLVCRQVCFFVEGKSGGSTLWIIGPADSLIEICSWLWVGKNLCWILKLFVSSQEGCDSMMCYLYLRIVFFLNDQLYVFDGTPYEAA